METKEDLHLLVLSHYTDHSGLEAQTCWKTRSCSPNNLVGPNPPCTSIPSGCSEIMDHFTQYQ